MNKSNNSSKILLLQIGISLLLIILLSLSCNSKNEVKSKYGNWMTKPQSDWPQITMINQITYIDNTHPIAGCSFLLETEHDTIAATAKHILMFFKSDSMQAISFNNTLKTWKMFPKNNPEDSILIDKLINENTQESLSSIPSDKDWLLFTIKNKSQSIQPLKFRTSPMQKGEKVYIVGWRYSDKNCPQVIYEGNFESIENGSVLISTKKLADNTMPGLSGSPVIDSNGYLIGLMSQKAEKLEKLSSIRYPQKIIANKLNSK